MTLEEKKSWEELVDTVRESGWFPLRQELCSSLLAAAQRIKQLEEAVEWALSHGGLYVCKSSTQETLSAQWNEDIAPELRRRAGKEGGE